MARRQQWRHGPRQLQRQPSLTPEEQLDSDEIRNNDGDEVVDPPERWIEAKEEESLDERLADEEPDVADDGRDEPTEAHDSDSGGGSSWSPTMRWIGWIRKCTAVNAARSTAHPRTAIRSSPSRSDGVRYSEPAFSTITERASTVTFAPASCGVESSSVPAAV